MLAEIAFNYEMVTKFREMPAEAYTELKEKFPRVFDGKQAHWYHTSGFVVDAEEMQWISEKGYRFEVRRIRGMSYDQHPRSWLTNKPDIGSVMISVAGAGLFSVNSVKLMEDCCTDELQRHLDEGWRIVACCPPNDQRRPTYILGVHKDPSGYIRNQVVF